MEQKEGGCRNLRTDPMGTVEAMGRIEGREWLEQQQEISRELAGMGSIDWDDVGGIAHESVAGALEKLARRGESRVESNKIFTINGAMHHRYFVFGDGSVKFSSRHAGDEDTPKRREILELVRREGFGIFPSPSPSEKSPA